ncbi:MAG: nucleoside hydrolase [Erysipelotrichaceae bacterium]|nr:nucleoside hydrolase [Erysipelotrichaceae bacterium]
MNKRKIIFDTDPGIDDAVALLTLLNVESFEVLGITSVAGNKGIQHTTDNASKLINYAQKNIKVYRGAHSSYQRVKDGLIEEVRDGGNVHGEDGLGGVNLPIDSDNISAIGAIDFILDSVRTYPGEVEIISVGPMTNLALAIDQDETTMRKVKKIWSMGGGVFRGNVTPVAEFNYWFDTISVEKVYSLGNDVDIVMVGLDATHQCIFDANDLTFIRLAAGEKGELIYAMVQDYLNAYWKFNNYIGIVIHDLLPVLMAIDPTVCTRLVHSNLRIVHQGLTKGQCIVDLADSWKLNKNAFVAMDMDVRKCKELFMEVCFGLVVKETYVGVFPTL